MSKKNRKPSTRHNPDRKPSPTHNPGVNQDFPKKKTAVAVIMTGVSLALWFAFAPESWWQPGNAEISAAKHSMIGLVAASMALSTLMLTSNNSENIYRAALYLTTGGVAWFAAFFALEVKTLKVAFWMSLCLLPLAITASGIYVPKPTRNNAGVMSLFVGIAMVVMSFVLSDTKAGLIVLSVLIDILGEFFGAELIVELVSFFIVLIGISGIVLILVMLGYGWAKSLGNAQSKVLMSWIQTGKKGDS